MLLDQDWMQQSSVSIYNLPATYACYSLDNPKPTQTNSICCSLPSKHNSMWPSAFGWIIKLKETFQHMLSHQSKYSYPRPKIKSKTKTGFGTWQESEGMSMVSKGERKRHQHLKNILSHLRRFCWWSPNRSDLPRKQTPWKILERQRNNFKLGELKKPKLSLSHLGVDKWSVANVSKITSQ